MEVIPEHHSENQDENQYRGRHVPFLLKRPDDLVPEHKGSLTHKLNVNKAKGYNHLGLTNQHRKQAQKLKDDRKKRSEAIAKKVAIE